MAGSTPRILSDARTVRGGFCLAAYHHASGQREAHFIVAQASPAGSLLVRGGDASIGGNDALPSSGEESFAGRVVKHAGGPTADSGGGDCAGAGACWEECKVSGFGSTWQRDPVREGRALCAVSSTTLRSANDGVRRVRMRTFQSALTFCYCPHCTERFREEHNAEPELTVPKQCQPVITRFSLRQV